MIGRMASTLLILGCFAAVVHGQGTGYYPPQGAQAQYQPQPITQYYPAQGQAQYYSPPAPGYPAMGPQGSPQGAPPQQNVSEMYDRNYTPDYSVVNRVPPPEGFQGALPAAGSAAAGVGSFLWGFLPAPLRNDGPNPYVVAPGQGSVNIQFVPGAR